MGERKGSGYGGLCEEFELNPLWAPDDQGFWMMYHKEDIAALHFGRNETMYQSFSTEKERAGWRRATFFKLKGAVLANRFAMKKRDP